MKPNYERAIAVLIAESLGISASRLSVKTDLAKSTVVVSWPTSMLLKDEKRAALIEKAQALLPEPLRLSIS
jgi:hypothetical protein